MGAINKGVGYFIPKTVVYYHDQLGVKIHITAIACALTSRLRTVASTSIRGIILYFSNALRLARYVEFVPALP